MDALNQLWRHIGLWLVGLGSARLGFGLLRRLARFGCSIFPKFLLRLLPVLNCCSTFGRSMFVKFVGAPGDLRSRIGRRLGVGFWFSPGLSLGCFIRRRRRFFFRLRLSGLGINLGLFRLGVRRRRGFFCGLRLVGLCFSLRQSDPCNRLSRVGLHRIQEPIAK